MTVEIHNTDCLEFLKKRDSESINLTVTSPPYNVGIPYDGHEDNMPMDKYAEWIKSILVEITRCTKPFGYVAVNIAETSSIPLAAYYGVWLVEAGLTVYRTITWEKPQGAANYAPLYQNGYPRWYFPFITTEHILIYSKGDPNGNRGEKKEPIDRQWLERFATTVWRFNPESKDVGHPVAYPEILPSTVIRFFTHIGDVVFDPFLGSGTTGVAATKMGRSFVGCEKSKEYYEVARKRITAEEQPGLFDPTQIY